MSAATKTLAKSLHTVTVIVRVARLMRKLRSTSNEVAVTHALELLGYHDAADPYGLAAAALKQLDQ